MLSNIKTIVYRALPDSWLLYSGTAKNNSIYLTFDDGPHGDYTKKLLDLLNNYRIKASFFVTGDHIKEDPEGLKKIISHGHDVYNHSYKHWEFEGYDIKQKLKDLEELDKLFPGNNIRPPRGKLDFRLLINLILNKRSIIFWSFDSLDYKKESAEKIVDRFMKYPVKAGDIILFHDDNDHTITALESLIPFWKESGYSILPVRELIK